MESRFSPLLSTNYVPSRDELNDIRNLLTDPTDQLSQLDTEIAHLQSIIEGLTLKRDHLYAHILGHRNLIAPLRRVPKELLQEIFFHCLPVDHNAVMSCHEAPLLLGRVCSQWRSVSLSTPRLWSSIHIVIGGDANLPWPIPDFLHSVSQNFSTPEAVGVWLSRSGGLPLSVSLYQAARVHTPQEEVDDILSTLIQFSSRWKNVSLFIKFPTSSQLSLLSPETLPLLETLSFFGAAQVTHSPTPHPEATPLDVFRAPHIRTVSFCHLGMVPKDMCWSQLTSLSLGSHGHGAAMLTSPKVLDILGKSQNLVYCELDFTDGWGSGFPPFDDQVVVTMPSLEILSIHEGTRTLEYLFEHLRLPVLVNLEFAPSNVIQHPSTWPVDGEGQSIYALLSRLESLQTLTLSAMKLTSTTLMNCLQRAPSITRLSILTPHPPDSWPYSRNIWTPFTDEVAALLTPTEGQPLVCPRLQVLECNPCDVSDAALLNMIQHRTVHAATHNVQPLERVDVILHRQSEVDILSMLPPHVLAETTIALQYISLPVFHRRITPKAGLEKPRKLHILSSTHKRLYH